jgi:hypothetical protein
MFVERETIYASKDVDMCLGGNLTLKYSTADDGAFVALERILREYDEFNVVDSTHFSRDDGTYCRYYIDPREWLNEDFQQAIVMWQLEF